MNTPRTNNIARGNHVVPTEWAEELERELDRITARLQTVWDEAAGMHPSMTADQLIDAIEERLDQYIRKQPQNSENTDRFILDTESGFIYDSVNEEWLDTPERVYLEMSQA
jgi:hypothetical protein